MGAARQGITKLVIINGHGGNNAPNHVVRDTLSQENIFPVAFSWWQMVPREMGELAEEDGESVGHGGEWENSVMLHLREHLVFKELMNNDIFVNPFSDEIRHFAGFSERRRDTRDITGTMGSALAASAEKGKKIFDHAVNHLEQLAREFHTVPPRDYREFGSHCS